MPSSLYDTPAGGGYRITSTGDTGGGGGSNDWLMSLAQRRAAQEAEMRDLELRAAKDAMLRSKAPKLESRDPYEDKMRELDMQERVAQVRARTQAPPKKLMTGFNINPGWVNDTENMNAYQREAFVPQGAGMVSTPGPSPAGLSGGGAGGAGGAGGGFSLPDDNESIADRAKRMYGDWAGNTQRRDAQDYGRKMALLSGV